MWSVFNLASDCSTTARTWAGLLFSPASRPSWMSNPNLLQIKTSFRTGAKASPTRASFV